MNLESLAIDATMTEWYCWLKGNFETEHPFFILPYDFSLVGNQLENIARFECCWLPLMRLIEFNLLQDTWLFKIPQMTETGKLWSSLTVETLKVNFDSITFENSLIIRLRLNINTTLLKFNLIPMFSLKMSSIVPRNYIDNIRKKLDFHWRLRPKTMMKILNRIASWNDCFATWNIKLWINIQWIVDSDWNDLILHWSPKSQLKFQLNP